MFPALPSPRSTGARTARTSPAALAGAVAAGAALVLTTGCGILAPGQNGDMPDDINVTSPLMQEGQPLPAAYTCEGASDGASADGGEQEAQEASSPPLSWSGLPDEAGSIALVVDDPQVAQVFWVVYDLDPQLVELRQNSVPADAKQGQNSQGVAEYGAPCPEPEASYEYRFTVYALANPLDLPEGASLDAALDAIADQAVARGSLVTTNAG
ncbi:MULTISPECIES: YbhB/YbcL family Raf kinase inhibitor-like protein [Nocardiopsidaceae]|uniref:YbhB/YbcL family Raf kinase inhibitor-like protein n=2 Tax=Nocardiopsidaceae TaxID=83676 RepID=A0ABY6YSL8_9ACTN|nr:MULTISPECIES: YbhB/YbcL family Raf kinase inhibitor-like protein [Nocardiopsaceae]MEE2045278.1 YbhB/YbcL family Raf kinase inhibitor-like protein [Nocardiopsis tropica]MEE2051054.1 YbhB/YbcL family Raf kinase inhibitor-like protein [Nocardiopsis umidischolae]WAE75345.1 YbhB/YbcL family Raf kinase inhibitor-like protein [Streptomonospora nanhaiensis]